MSPDLPERALVLTAGYGARMRPLTLRRAKPAVPVAGVTLIRRILGWLSRQGIREVVLNLHHRPESITTEVGDGSDLGLRARYVWEPAILGSAGGVRHALSVLGVDRFFVVNGDTLSDVDLAGLAAAHVSARARVTLAVGPRLRPDRYGGVVADEQGRVLGFAAPGDPARSHHYVGVQLVDASVFEPLPDNRPASTIGGLYTELATDAPGSIRVERLATRCLDVGTPADYLDACLALAAEQGLTELPVGAGSRIAPTARVSRSAIWSDVRIEEGCDLVECVVADGSTVPAGARYRRQAIAPADGRSAAGNATRIGNLLVAPIDP